MGRLIAAVMLVAFVALSGCSPKGGPPVDVTAPPSTPTTAASPAADGPMYYSEGAFVVVDEGAGKGLVYYIDPNLHGLSSLDPRHNIRVMFLADGTATATVVCEPIPVFAAKAAAPQGWTKVELESFQPERSAGNCY